MLQDHFVFSVYSLTIGPERLGYTNDSDPLIRINKKVLPDPKAFLENCTDIRYRGSFSRLVDIL